MQLVLLCANPVLTSCAWITESSSEEEEEDEEETAAAASTSKRKQPTSYQESASAHSPFKRHKGECSCTSILIEVSCLPDLCWYAGTQPPLAPEGVPFQVNKERQRHMDPLLQQLGALPRLKGKSQSALLLTVVMR